MSKSLTSSTIASKSRRYGTSPINLLEIEFGGVTGTKYYSDREVVIGGNTYEAVVKDWGDIDFIINRSATTSDIRISLVNTLSSPISNIFSVDNPESKVARLYQWYEGNEEVDKTLLFNGRITSPIKYTLDTVELDIVNRILDLSTKVGRVITKSEFPRSLESHRGKVIPQVIGLVENVPAVCIFTAGKNALRESLTDISLTIEADDGSVFPSDSAWVLVIEDEQILMEANSSGGNTLTVTQRAYNGTSAHLHIKGIQMYEQLSSFRYQVFDDQNGVKASSITNVRVNGVLLDPSAYTIDQVTYPGQIVFTTYPQIDQEKETDFDEYTFDTVVNDGSVPFADNPDYLIDDNNSNFAQLKSGKRVVLQRAASLNNTNQLKRTYLVVKYSTDREEWDGEIQAKAYWDGNNLGLLPDPSFDPVSEEEEELGSAASNPIINPYNPVGPTPYGGAFDMVKGPEAELVSENYTEDIDASSLSIETPEFDPDAYKWELEVVPDNKVPSAYFSAFAQGTTGKVTYFYHTAVVSFPKTWGADAANFRWVDWVFGGFSFSPPSQGGTARLINVTVNYKDEFQPHPAASNPLQYRIKKSGVHDLEIINPRSPFVPLKFTPIFVDEISEFYVVMRTSVAVTSITVRSSEEFDPVSLELWGKLHGVYLKAEYEITREAPTSQQPPTIISPPVVIPKQVRKSHEVEKVFEITDYVDDWGDLLNKSAEIVFESDGAKPGSNLYVKDMHILTESSKYTFEYTDEITADVNGFYVDGSVIDNNYGDTNEVITRPDQIIKFLLTWNSIFSLSDLDLNFYDAAAVFYHSQYYQLDFAIVEETTLRDILEKIAFQIRTDQYWEAGKHRIKVLEVSTSAIKQVSASDIETMSIERSDIEELVNLLEIRYTIDYSFLISYTPNKFRSILTIENPGSQAEYGTRESRDETFYFDYIRHDITASHVANYYLSFYSVIRRYVNMRCFLNQLELDKHDIVGISFPLDNLSNTPGRILSNTLSMGGNTEIDQIEFYVLMEDYTYHKLELTDGIEFSDAILLDLIPLVSSSDGVEFSDAINFGFNLNLIDSVKFSEVFSYITHKTLLIRDGYDGGWGNQMWGSSIWGGNDTSFIMSEELTLEKLAALGTGFVNESDVFVISEELTLILAARAIETNKDEFFSQLYIGDSLTISLV